MFGFMNNNRKSSCMDANVVTSSTCDAKMVMTSSQMVNRVDFSGTAIAVSVLFLLVIIGLISIGLINLSLILITLIIISRTAKSKTTDYPQKDKPITTESYRGFAFWQNRFIFDGGESYHENYRFSHTYLS